MEETDQLPSIFTPRKETSFRRTREYGSYQFFNHFRIALPWSFRRTREYGRKCFLRISVLPAPIDATVLEELESMEVSFVTHFIFITSF